MNVVPNPLLSCSLKAKFLRMSYQSFASIWGLYTRSTKSESLGNSLEIFILNKFFQVVINYIKISRLVV